MDPSSRPAKLASEKLSSLDNFDVFLTFGVDIFGGFPFTFDSKSPVVMLRPREAARESGFTLVSTFNLESAVLEGFFVDAPVKGG